MLEKCVNKDGQEQKINNLDMIIKLEDKFLQVRLIRTEKWKTAGEFTPPMPRAKFIHPIDLKDNFYYLINKKDLVKLLKHK